MDGEGTDVVCVCVKLVDAFKRVVVEDSDFHIVGSGEHPMLSSDEFGSTNW